MYRGRFFDYPIRASNAFLNLGPVETARCLVSYAQARMHPVVDPQSFEDWVSNQFGRRLFEIFFKTYTEKVWGIPTSELSADWAGQRIRGLNLVEVIRNAVLPPSWRGGEHAIVKTLVDAFRYPRLGAGQMWESVAARLKASGHPVRLGEEVVAVRHAGGRVLSVVVRDGVSGTIDVLGTEFISTMPIRELVALGICRADEVKAGMVYRQPKAYPVYDGAYLGHVAVVREWLQRALPNLWLVGRNGMHHYNNQDHSMMTGILVARNIATGAHYDPWLVNTDAEYQEEERAGESAGRQVPERIAS